MMKLHIEQDRDQRLKYTSHKKSEGEKKLSVSSALIFRVCKVVFMFNANYKPFVRMTQTSQL